MSRSNAFLRDVARVESTASCIDIADEMDQHTVGCVLVIDGEDLVGIVTDRDLTCRVVAAGLDPEKTTAADVMTRDPIFATEKDEVEDLLRIMAEQGIRRVPLVEDGKVVGLVSLDDIVVQLSSWIFNLNQGMLGGLHEARRTQRFRHRAEARDDALEELRAQLVSSSRQVRERVREAMNDVLERIGRS